VDTSLAVGAMPHHRANQQEAAGVLHRALTDNLKFQSFMTLFTSAAGDPASVC
jgi:hypothetical protein